MSLDFCQGYQSQPNLQHSPSPQPSGSTRPDPHNDFGIKYFSKEDLDHLVDSLKKYYEVKVDPEGRELVKIELDWDYKNKKVRLSMKPYLDKLLRQFENVVPSKCQDSPFPH
ncbi:hypothetical protein ACHAW6_012321, partial [Cyclotella cf. meneghiniana]